MHKLSEEIDIALLKNQTVSHISFGINYILLSLDASSIQFSGPFTFKTEEKEYEREEVFPVKSDFGLLSLLEKRIESVYCNQERTSLTIQFDGNLLLLLKSNQMYECFELYIAGNRAIV